MKKLQVHQFTQGNETNSKAVYFKNVYQYWNVNSLIRSIAHSEKSGVSLCLIKDKNASHSYFVFAIRNGGTISLLTDKPQWAHPGQKDMSRRPGRDFSERISENHFPYSLMNIAYDYRGDAFVLEDKTSLVPYQAKAIPLKEVKDLEPDEVIWTMMMFELIENKFWKESFRTKELSYTGEMMHVKEASEELVNALALNSHKAIEAPYITKEDVTTENTKEMWEDKQTAQNEWIEKRYEHLVGDELLNLIDTSDKLKLLPVNSTDIHSMMEMTSTELSNYKNTREKQPLVQYEALSMLEFGTKEELLDDQRWYARYNKAKQLNMFAIKEFEETKEEIKNWYKQAVVNNIDSLLKAVAEGEFVTEGFEYGQSMFETPTITSKNILRNYLEDDYWVNQDIGVQLWNNKDECNHTCYLTGNPIFIRARFIPSTPTALAKICGCEVNNLPEVLQYWTNNEIYSGNHLLRKVDPMEWVIQNPWRKLGFDVVIYLSKKGYNQIRKQFNLPPNKFWLENK
jgi:hypothetical protein